MTRLLTWLSSFRQPRSVDLSTAESVDISALRVHLKLLKTRIDYHTTCRDDARAAGRLNDSVLHETLREAFDVELTTLASFLKVS